MLKKLNDFLAGLPMTIVAGVFLLLPIALLFAESTLSMLQTIAIIAAFPLGIIIILIVRSFLKDLRDSEKSCR